jgi:GTPase SAR1 family protein
MTDTTTSQTFAQVKDEFNEFVSSFVPKSKKDPRHKLKEKLVELQDVIPDLEDRLRQLQNSSSVILLHGTTGSGKSTFASRYKSKKSAPEFLDAIRSGTKHKEVEGISQGDGVNPCTLVPNVLANAKNGTLIIDMPGLNDQSLTKRFVIGIIHRLLMRDLGRSVGSGPTNIVVFVPVQKILNGNNAMATWLPKVVDDLKTILGEDTETFQTGVKSIVFVINHIDEYKMNLKKQVSDKKLKLQVKKQLMQLFLTQQRQKNSHNMMFFFMDAQKLYAD